MSEILEMTHPRLAIFGNDYMRDHIDEALSLLVMLQARNIDFVVEGRYARLLQDCRPETSFNTFDDATTVAATVALSLGGDGTLLTVVADMAPRGIPILGLNAGHLGYLTACSMAEAELVVDELLTGRLTVDRRTMLQVQCDQATIDRPFALNEVAILRQDTSSTIAMHTKLNGVPLTTYKGDGLVVSTPTGSTAYNMSAGGPVMAPSTPCLVLTPVSPHSLTMRPLVVGQHVVVTVQTTTRSLGYQVSLDGEGFNCPNGSEVAIKRALFDALIVQRPEANFATTLRNKLHWGV